MSDADDMAHASYLEYLEQKDKEENTANFDALQRRVKRLEVQMERLLEVLSVFFDEMDRSSRAVVDFRDTLDWDPGDP